MAGGHPHGPGGRRPRDAPLEGVRVLIPVAGAAAGLAGGLALLVLGAEGLVRGGARIAAAAGVSSLVVGLTVVAFGTSAPEFAVSLTAALGGRADVALGNVVGSNIFNVLFILGLSAAIVPLAVHRQVIVREVPVMIGVSLLAGLLALDGSIGRLDGALLAAGIVAYTVWAVRTGRREVAATPGPPGGGAGGPAGERPRGKGLLVAAVLAVVGLALLVLGARWFVGAAVTLARAVGLSELVIGLTIVAAGTSMPEVATSVVAALRGERDIAVGNVVGSNIFNILAVLGVSAAAAPAGVAASPAALAFDIPVMVAVAAACLPVFAAGHVIARWQGALFIAYYAAYVAYLLLDAQGHAALPVYRAAMLGFVVPLTAGTLLVLAARSLRRGRR